MIKWYSEMSCFHRTSKRFYTHRSASRFFDVEKHRDGGMRWLKAHSRTRGRLGTCIGIANAITGIKIGCHLTWNEKGLGERRAADDREAFERKNTVCACLCVYVSGKKREKTQAYKASESAEIDFARWLYRDQRGRTGWRNKFGEMHRETGEFYAYQYIVFSVLERITRCVIFFVSNQWRNYYFTIIYYILYYCNTIN